MENNERKETVEINLNSVQNSEELHDLLKKKLDFPDFYGMNWNAFWDAITGLVELPDNTDLSVDGYEYQGVKYAKITCHFDIRRGESGKRHTGVDLTSWKKFVPIKSFISGEVLGCFWNGSRKERVLDGTGGYGNLMLIKGDNAYLYLLGHLTSCLIPCGRIYPGQDVAMSGQTGYSTGYHLHLEIFKLPEALKDKKETAFFAKIGGSDNYQSIHDKIKAERCNPFDHNDKFNTYEE